MNLYVLIYSTMRRSITQALRIDDLVNAKENEHAELEKEITKFFCQKYEPKIDEDKAPFHLEVDDGTPDGQKLIDLNAIFDKKLIKNGVKVMFSEKLKKAELKLNTSAPAGIKEMSDPSEFNRDSMVNLYNCLQLFMKEEKLDEMNTWYCKKCKDSKEALIKMIPYKLPPVLIVHLKRFKNTRQKYRYYSSRDEYMKNQSLVDCPVEGLDMTKYVETVNGKPAVYDLYGVVNHYGNTGGGHYIAYCKHPFSNKWIVYDDSRCKIGLSEREVIRDSAYVIFYRLRNF